MLVARGVPVFLLYRKVLSPPERIPMALLSATGLPLIVVITSIALAEGKMLPVNAASLVAAGCSRCCCSPPSGLWRMREAGLAVAITDDGPDDGVEPDPGGARGREGPEVSSG